MSSLPETAGTIYDLGYRHYDGPRLGRRGAIGAIVGAGLRAVFGLGRSGRSKILPWGALVLAVMPAVVAVAIRVLVGDIVDLYSYSNYLWSIGALLPIFLAAQAPELVVNDMRHRVLPLYFSRPIGRFDYVYEARRAQPGPARHHAPPGAGAVRRPGARGGGPSRGARR